MEDEKSFEKKYNKSKNNLQCLGPCYHPNTLVIHPITLEYITDKENFFCPVKEWVYKDKESGKNISLLTDVCYKPTKLKDDDSRELEMNIILPYIDFNCEQFLKIYYNIFSFEDAVEWISSKKYLPFRTRQRVIDCAWRTYGKSVEYIDNVILDFYINLIKKKMIGSFYDKLHRYVHINGDKIYFGNPATNKLKSGDYSVQRINYIIEKFVNNDELHRFLIKFAINKKKDLDKVESMTEQIEKGYIEYIKNRIAKTIKH